MTEMMPLIPFGYAKRHGILAVAVEEGTRFIHLASVSPFVWLELAQYLPKPFSYERQEKEIFEQTLAMVYQAKDALLAEANQDLSAEVDVSLALHDLNDLGDLLDIQDDAPIIRLINALFAEAIKRQASDIHLESFEQEMVVRYRMDGLLSPVFKPPKALAPLLVSRIKVMAKLDIAEKRLPQDGRIALKIAGRQVDVRVSTLPSGYGERVVLRLLDKQNARLDLSHLGMSATVKTHLNQLIHEPHGIILVTGPTGSGKTTSLYAMLTELNNPSRNILTVEDPIEYYLEGIGQTQVNTKVNMTFAKGLRAMLRQDPDVVMVGEIRDLETAEIAVQASLTGHLVLSTLHTNTAIGAITRLQDMGVEPFLLASSLIGVAAQRLVRMLCPHCKIAHHPTPSERLFLGAEIECIYQPKGCELCVGTGYKGRTGIYELIIVDDHLREMMHNKCSEQDMIRHCRQQYPSIRVDGIRRIQGGETTIEEVFRVTNERV